MDRCIIARQSDNTVTLLKYLIADCTRVPLEQRTRNFTTRRTSDEKVRHFDEQERTYLMPPQTSHQVFGTKSTVVPPILGCRR